MKIQSTLMTLLLILFASTYASAQSKLTEDQQKTLQEQYEAYKTKLSLSEDQQVKVKSINATYFEGLAALKSSGGSKLSRLKKFRTLQSAKDSQMKTVLDNKQYDTYQEMQQQMREEFKKKKK